MTDLKTIVIVGAGLSGDTAAAALRQEGFAGSITLVGEEPHRPYDRPPLSKAALANPAEVEKVFFHSPAWYDEQNIGLILGDGAASIDPAAHRVTLHSGRELPYDKLLLATGTRARRLRLLEINGAPVFYLRSLDDCEALRPLLIESAHIAVIGAGVIGLETAATAASLGCAVTVIEASDRVMARSVSPSVSSFMTDYHGAKGVRILLGAKVTGFDHADGRATITLDDGERIEADAVIAGIGAEPVTELARDAGLLVDDGIVVDRYTRTSDPDIHAAGDAARFESVRHERHVRTEHWRHAIDQAEVAAKIMLGGQAHYEERPWVWSDQFDLNIQITGEGNGETEILRGRTADAAFIAFQLRDGRLIGATTINQSRHKRAIGDLVVAHAVVDPALLADATVDLKKLAASLKS